MNDRQAAIAEGVGLIAAGHEVRDASASVGIPKSTLYDAYVRTLGTDRPDLEERRKQADSELMAGAYCVAMQGIARMAREIELADPKNVTAWTEVSSKALSRLRGWGLGNASGWTDTAPRWLNALSQVLEQGGATLSVTVEPAKPKQP